MNLDWIRQTARSSGDLSRTRGSNWEPRNPGNPVKRTMDMTIHFPYFLNDPGVPRGCLSTVNSFGSAPYALELEDRLRGTIADSRDSERSAAAGFALLASMVQQGDSELAADVLALRKQLLEQPGDVKLRGYPLTDRNFKPPRTRTQPTRPAFRDFLPSPPLCPGYSLLFGMFWYVVAVGRPKRAADGGLAYYVLNRADARTTILMSDAAVRSASRPGPTNWAAA